MTKEQWVRHAEEVTGLKRPSAYDGAMYPDWKSALKDHTIKCPHCPECKDRKKTRKATMNAQIRHELYSSLGLVRVKGALGGTYYE